MSLPRRMIALGLGVVLAASPTAVLASGPAAGLCTMDTARGAVPASFAIDACVDRFYVWLRNTLEIPLVVKADGASAPLAIVEEPDQSLAAMTTRVGKDPWMLMPGDVARIPVGSAAMTVALRTTDADRTYAMAKGVVTVESYKDIRVEVWETIAAVFADGWDAWHDYRNCLVGKDWVAQMGCTVVLEAAIVAAAVFHMAKFALGVIPIPQAKLVAAILDVGEYLMFNLDADKHRKVIQASSTLTLTGTAAAAPSTSPKPSPKPTSASQAPTITGSQTHVEDALVLARVYYSDPNGDVVGFGFRGVNGSPWAQETHPFSDPSYGRLGPGWVEYPFNHECGTGAEYETDIEMWVYDAAGHQSSRRRIHLDCTP